ncbi:MAG: KilA-N domain-containing protein [Methylocella sp.]
MPLQNITQFTVRGRRVRVNENGLVCLNDIHVAAGFSKNQKPNDWFRLGATHKLIEAVFVRITGKSRNWTKDEIKSVFYSKVGADGGTFADPRLALAYAEYLNPKLALEVREVFLRHKSGDATLADETLQRSTPEDNEWAAVRALGRAKRRHFTSVLQEHEVVRPIEFATVTNAVYGGLWGRTAAALKAKRGLKKTANLRDALNTNDLVYVMAGEQLAAERIGYEDSRGVRECSIATTKSASFIRQAIESDRADRRKPTQ